MLNVVIKCSMHHIIHIKIDSVRAHGLLKDRMMFTVTCVLSIRFDRYLNYQHNELILKFRDFFFYQV